MIFFFFEKKLQSIWLKQKKFAKKRRTKSNKFYKSNKKNYPKSYQSWSGNFMTTCNEISCFTKMSNETADSTPLKIIHEITAHKFNGTIKMEQNAGERLEIRFRASQTKLRDARSSPWSRLWFGRCGADGAAAKAVASAMRRWSLWPSNRPSRRTHGRRCPPVWPCFSNLRSRNVLEVSPCVSFLDYSPIKLRAFELVHRVGSCFAFMMSDWFLFFNFQIAGRLSPSLKMTWKKK